MSVPVDVVNRNTHVTCLPRSAAWCLTRLISRERRGHVGAMPNTNVDVPKNQTFEFHVKVSQDGVQLTPPSTIPFNPGPVNIVGLTRQPDDGGDAVFRINGINEGTAMCTIGSGDGVLNLSVTVTAAEPGPIVFQVDGPFVRV